MIAVGGLSSLSSEDKELGLFISVLLQLALWEVAFDIFGLSSNGRQICIAKGDFFIYFFGVEVLLRYCFKLFQGVVEFQVHYSAFYICIFTAKEFPSSYF